jgi:hypothetical protein
MPTYAVNTAETREEWGHPTFGVTPPADTGEATPPRSENGMRRIDGSWSGWSGNTVVTLTDGSIWKQSEYYYQYRYAYRPEVQIQNGKMLVAGMRRSVRVQRLR